MDCWLGILHTLSANSTQGPGELDRRGLCSLRPEENHPSPGRTHPGLGSQVWRAPSTQAKQEMLQSDPTTLPEITVTGTALSLREYSSGGVELLSHYMELGKNPSGTSPHDRLCEIC